MESLVGLCDGFRVRRDYGVVVREKWEGEVFCDLDEEVVVHRGLGCGVVRLFRLVGGKDRLLLSKGVPLDCSTTYV